MRKYGVIIVSATLLAAMAIGLGGCGSENGLGGMVDSETGELVHNCGKEGIVDIDEKEIAADRIYRAVANAKASNAAIAVTDEEGNITGGIFLNGVGEALAAEGDSNISLMMSDGRYVSIDTDGNMTEGLKFTIMGLLEQAIYQMDGGGNIDVIEVREEDKKSDIHDYYAIRIHEDALREIYKDCPKPEVLEGYDVVDLLKKEADVGDKEFSVTFTVGIIKEEYAFNEDYKEQQMGMIVRAGSIGEEKVTAKFSGYKVMSDWELNREMYDDDLWTIDNGTALLLNTSSEYQRIMSELGLS